MGVLGIDLNDENGKLKNTYDLIKEIGAKLESMPKNAEYAQILSNLFGARQIQAGSVLLDKYNQLDEVINKINSDSGIASKEYEMRMNSTSAKLQQMKQTINQVWEKSISSDFTKGLVEGVTQLIKVFGNLPTVIGLATTALMLFKGTAIKDAIVSIVSFTGSLITASSAVGATAVATDFLTLAMTKLKLAFASNPLGLIAIVATTAIVAFASLHKSMQEVTDDIVAQGENVKKLQESIDDLESKQARLNELNSKTKLNNDEKKELITLNNQLSETYPELISQYNTESGCFEVSAESLQKLIDKKRENAMMENAINLGDARKQVEQYQKQIDEAMKQLSSGKRRVTNASGTVEFERELSTSQKQELMDTITQAQENIDKLSTTVNQGTKYINDYYNELIKGGASTEEATNELQRLGYTTNDISYALSMATSNTNGTSEKIKLLSEALREINANSVSQQTISDLNKMFPELGINSENASEKVNLLTKTLKELDNGTSTQEIQNSILGIGEASEDSAQKTQEAISKATEEYSKASESIAKCQSYIDKLNKAQEVTPSIAKQIAKAYPEIGESITDVGSCIEFLNDKIQEQVTVQENALAIMKGDDEQFYQDKIANNSEYENYINGFLQRFVGNSNENYNIDLSNYRTLNEMKQSANDSLGMAIDSWLSNYIDTTASTYEIDYSNFSNLVSAKQEILKAFAGSLAQFWDDASQSFTEQAYGGIDLSGGASNEFYEQYTQKAQGILDIRDKIRAAYNDLDNIYAGGGLNLNHGIAGGMGSGSGYSGSGGSGGSGGSSRGSRGGKSEAEKAQEEAEKWRKKIAELNSEIDTDRYFDLNNALADINNALTNNKTIQEQLYGSALINAQKQEIELMKQKQEAINNINKEQIKEADELRNYLTQYGFYFDENNKLINSQQRLLEIQESVNAMAGETEEEYNKKKEWVDWVKELEENTQSYCDLIEDKIPNCTNDFKELGNSIKQLQLDTLESLREELAGNILEDMQEELKASQEALEEAEENDIEALEKEKQAMIDSYDKQIESLRKELEALDDDYEDKKKKLKALKNELKLWEKDDSVNIFCIKYIDINAPYVQKCA